MPGAIQASEKNLDKVFCNDYLFEIPVFQRPYAWTTEEVDDLLDDLLFAVDKDDQEPYFLGSIVLIKEDAPSSLVVDGQQRLTTLTMLLCSLRELADDDFKSPIDVRIRQKSDPLTGAQEVVRVALRRQDRQFFHKYVQSEGGIQRLLDTTPKTETDSQVRICENASTIHRKLSELGPEKREKLASFIISQCYLVVVSTPSQTSAYRIFSVLNNRGLDLSATDIMKAEIIGELNNEEQKDYGDKWENIEQELGRNNFSDLFTHIRMIYAKNKQRRAITEEFSEHVLSKHTGKNFIDLVLDQYDDVYKQILGLSGGREIFEPHLKSLRLLDNTNWIPPAMAFFYHNADAPDLLSRFTKDLERLAFGLLAGAQTLMIGLPGTPTS